MANFITTGGVHHVTLTVGNVNRSKEFYTGVLGFQVAGEFGPRVLMSNGSVLLVVGPPSGGSNVPGSNSFDENRLGLDHLSFSVSSRDDLEQAIPILDQHRVPHGDIVDLADFAISVLMLRDPDNIQIELTASTS